MSKQRVVLGTALLCVPVTLLIQGCTRYCRGDVIRTTAAPYHEEPAPVVARVAELLPPNAKAGECYVKVFVPEKFETVTETVCVREASDRLEIVPARYEWVEETILVKDASTVLEEVPAEFAWQDRSIQTDPGHQGWQVEKKARCVSDPQQQMAEDVYCLVKHEPVYETVRTQVLAKPVTTRQVAIPAEYQTVRRQKLVAPATTRRIAIPAEYASVQKTRKVADSRVEWQRVICQEENRTDGPSTVEATLAKSEN